MASLQRLHTADGSDTLFHQELGEHYHSTHGAVQESMHIFIGAGWDKLQKIDDPVWVFEMGFGTGLNALLTALAAQQKKRPVHYTTIELFPLPTNIWQSLNYPAYLKDPEAARLFLSLHASTWEVPHALSRWFTLTKHQANLLSFSPLPAAYDILYFDAFSPNTQPELWTTAIFKKMYSLLKPNGLLVTYSCKGEVKRHLAEAGFRTEKLPGPPGKREILRAWKS